MTSIDRRVTWWEVMSKGGTLDTYASGAQLFGALACVILNADIKPKLELLYMSFVMQKLPVNVHLHHCHRLHSTWT